MDQEQDQREAPGGVSDADASPDTSAAKSAPAPSDTPADTKALSDVLESTLTVLSEAIDRLESIVTSMEAGEADWEESVRLLSEANELAVLSSQKLDRVVQEVVYGATGEKAETAPAASRLEGFQEAVDAASGEDKQGS